MIELVKACADIQLILKRKKWKFCFIGGITVIRWGEPRLTSDIDITILTGFGSEEKYVDTLLDIYDPRRPDMKDFALRYRVLLLKTSHGYPIDISLGALPFEEKMIKRSTNFEYADKIRLRTCSADDLIITKAFADRDRDWLDIKGIMIRQKTKLDWRYIISQLKPLCELKENPFIVQRLKTMKKNHYCQ